MHFFYNSSNDVLVGTLFSDENKVFNKIKDDIFCSDNELNIFNPKQFNINVKEGFNKFDEVTIDCIKALTGIDFTYDFTSGVKVGYVESCVEHPDSDHMHVLKVNVGEEVLDIVCGASNIKEGLYVAVATPKSYMESINLFIKPSKLRGVPSNGMVCSKFELGLIKEQQKGIWEISETTELGKDVYTI